MASKTEDRLVSLFNQASGDSRAISADSAPSGGGTHASSPADFPAANDNYSFNPSGNSGPGQSYDGISGTSRSAQTSSGSGSGFESLATTIFGGALGLVPLIGGLFGLFGGGGSQPPVFQKYEMPSPISFEAGDVGGSLVNSDYGQMGLPRVYGSSDAQSAPTGGATAATASAPSAGAVSVSGGSAGGGTAAGVNSTGTPQISVNVQAMDAQSFMSYSGQIAQAVREAMLNLSSLNDVVTDL